jgi:hypothetical protein
MILHVVLSGLESQVLTLREEYRLRVSENMALRRIFGPERREIKRRKRKVHNEDFMICTLH